MAFITEDKPISADTQKAIDDCEIALLRKRMKELEEVCFDALTLRGLLAAATSPTALYADRQKFNQRVNEIEAKIRKVIFKRSGLKVEHCKVS